MYSARSELQPDRIEWGYLLIALEKSGFGPAFLDWIKILYSSPMASVRTNGATSDYFALHRGTLQG